MEVLQDQPNEEFAKATKRLLVSYARCRINAFLGGKHLQATLGNAFDNVSFLGLFGSCPRKWYGSYPSIQLEQECKCG